MEPIIGIIGGMGPKATLDFYGKLLKNFGATTDQGHPRVLIDSNTKVPDRTTYILNGGQNPLPELVKSAKVLIDGGATILAMPCNTAHYFYTGIVEAIDNESITFIHMIDETGRYLKRNNIDRVLLLATQGTYSTNLYQKALKNHEIEVVVPNESIQNDLMKMIYDLKKGRDRFEKEELVHIIEEARRLELKGIVLGCTELPLIFESAGMSDQAVDATSVLVQATIDEFYKKSMTVKKI
ncbi:aspartate racemase [Dethiosulfatibacter aminovorans DSM 17477]|uniref:Aspartate racemase n=1 Tax=Dethiosulfatibacter aminovorans DSM 17477 TaxID=1121476 RepID=A0A1M6ELR5_9FIRM|nr:amino acid racemase [Dethiosulfatibacter aminovorans]SHI86457.1 aspartate racemase [Dethiosulfatibacter aminovorans DSM 17477]